MTDRDDILDLDKRLSVHEAVCAQRYEELLMRMGRMEKIMLGAVGTILLAFLGIVISRLFH
jgi:hypothetical protein